MKAMKKVLAMVMALGVVMGMSSSAMAAGGDDGPLEGTGSSFTFTKEIAYFNPESVSINYPAVEFTYTVAPANVSGNPTITDSNSNTGVVKSGVAGGVVMGTDNKASFSGGPVNATSTGTILSDEVRLTIDLSKFTSAGIYRYKVTENRPANFEALGYEAAADGDGERYLDVYINNDAEGTGLAIAGYVMFTGSSDESLSPDDEVDGGKKTPGFTHENPDGETDYLDDTYIDKYKTFNVEITKSVTGTLGDKQNPFPFYASITAGTANASNVAVNVKDGLVQTLTLSNGAATATKIDDLKDGETVKLQGIPVGDTVAIYENNNTADTYTLTTSDFSTDVSNMTVAAGANSDSDSVTATTTNVETIKGTFTNNLDSPSPTGYVTRFAPYVLLVGFALVLLVVMRRRRNDHADMI